MSSYIVTHRKWSGGGGGGEYMFHTTQFSSPFTKWCTEAVYSTTRYLVIRKEKRRPPSTSHHETKKVKMYPFFSFPRRRAVGGNIKVTP